jgi:hypothetical protein
MNRKLQELFTIGKHNDLQKEINEMMVAITLHHTHPSAWERAKASRSCPTWDNVLDLLRRSYQEMNTCRYNPVKY